MTQRNISIAIGVALAGVLGTGVPITFAADANDVQQRANQAADKADSASKDAKQAAKDASNLDGKQFSQISGKVVNVDKDKNQLTIERKSGVFGSAQKELFTLSMKPDVLKKADVDVASLPKGESVTIAYEDQDGRHIIHSIIIDDKAKDKINY